MMHKNTEHCSNTRILKDNVIAQIGEDVQADV